MSDDHDPYRAAGRAVGGRIALAFAALIHLILGMVLFVPTGPVLRALYVGSWLVAAAVIWRFRRVGPWLLGVPFATALVWYALLQASLGRWGGA